MGTLLDFSGVLAMETENDLGTSVEAALDIREEAVAGLHATAEIGDAK